MKSKSKIFFAVKKWPLLSISTTSCSYLNPLDDSPKSANNQPKKSPIYTLQTLLSKKKSC